MNIIGFGGLENILWDIEVVFIWPVVKSHKDSAGKSGLMKMKMNHILYSLFFISTGCPIYRHAVRWIMTASLWLLDKLQYFWLPTLFSKLYYFLPFWEFKTLELQPFPMKQKARCCAKCFKWDALDLGNRSRIIYCLPKVFFSNEPKCLWHNNCLVTSNL